jgi:hypothetical protein
MRRDAHAAIVMIGIALLAVMVALLSAGGESRPPPLSPEAFARLAGNLPGEMPFFGSPPLRPGVSALAAGGMLPRRGGGSGAPAGGVADGEDPNDMPFEESLSGGDPQSGGTRRVLVAPGSNATPYERPKGTVDLALEWFKVKQAADGSWDGDARTTGLVLLAFLGAGETHKHGRYKKMVRNGLKWLKQQQDPAGFFAPQEDRGGHAIAALAMAEAYCLTSSPLFKQSATVGIQAVERLGPYTDPATWWMLCLRKSAKDSGLKSEMPEFDRTWAFVTPAEWSEVPGGTVNACRGAEILCRIFEGQDPRTETAIQELAAESLLHLPPAELHLIDPDHIYFTTLGMFQVGGKSWKEWNVALKEAVIPTQIREGPDAGSWEIPNHRGQMLGRTATTALMVMSVELYYRYAKVFGIR